MKRAVAVVLVILLLLLCGCKAKTGDAKKNSQNDAGAVSIGNIEQSTAEDLTGVSGAASSTLPTAQNDNNSDKQKFENETTTDKNGKSGKNSAKDKTNNGTTEKSNTTEAQNDDESTTLESYEMPRIPINP